MMIFINDERKRPMNKRAKWMAVLAAAMLVTTMLFAVSASAGSITAPYPIDGTYPYGSTSHTSSRADGETGHTFYSTKKVTLTAYASYYGNYCVYNTTTNTDYSSQSVSARINVAAPFTCIGAKSEHMVSSTATWTDTTTSGYYQ